VGRLTEGKRREAAKRYLEEIENLCDPQPAAMVRLAEAWAGFGTIEKAADLFTRAGELKLAEGDIQGARDLLNRALTLDPKHPAALAGVKRIETEYAEEMRSARKNDLLTSANNAEKNDRIREACDILTTYLGEFPEDIERKERWVELMISRTGGKGRLGESVSALSEEERDTLFGICTSVSEENRNRGELARSVHYLRIALDLRPEDEVLCRNLMDRCVELGLTGDAVRLGTELAGRFMRRGDAARAASIYRSLLDLDPENLDVRSELATALAEAGRPDEAKQAFAELSRVCVGRELVNQAVSALQSALRIDETDLDLRHMLGRAYGMKGDTGAAVAELDRVERTYRERGELLFAVAILREMVYLDPERGSLRARLGQTLVDAGRSAEAFDVYRDLALFYRARELPGKMIEAAMAALGIRPDDVPMSRLVVETYRDRGETNRAIGEAHRLAELLARSDPDSAEKVYRDVLTWCPEDAASYAALAQLAESQGKTREASDHHENLGRVLRSEGRFLEACSAWADALRNNDRKIALKEELVELYLDVGDEYHSNLLLEEIAEHYEKVGDYDEAVNRWLELADRNIQKAMDMSA
jgi:tetratricopeptide (TPR) repeat protein